MWVEVKSKVEGGFGKGGLWRGCSFRIGCVWWGVKRGFVCGGEWCWVDVKIVLKLKYSCDGWRCNCGGWSEEVGRWKMGLKGGGLEDGDEGDVSLM